MCNALRALYLSFVILFSFQRYAKRVAGSQGLSNQFCTEIVVYIRSLLSYTYSGHTHPMNAIKYLHSAHMSISHQGGGTTMTITTQNWRNSFHRAHSLHYALPAPPPPHFIKQLLDNLTQRLNASTPQTPDSEKDQT